MIKKFLIIFTFYLLVPEGAYGGGPAWYTKVIKFDRKSELSAVFELSSVDEKNNPFGSCKPLIVHSRYRGEPWYLLQAKTWSKLVTKEEHRKALDIVEEAWKSGRSIEFGYIGTGLVPINDGNSCEVKSRGLMPLESNGIVSFHDPV